MKERQRGIVVMVDGKHVKTVPRKYETVIYNLSFITDPDHKRLHWRERLELENRLFIQSLSWHERYLKELIEGEVIIDIEITNTRIMGHWLRSAVAVYSTGLRVIVPDRFMSLHKHPIEANRLL